MIMRDRPVAYGIDFGTSNSQIAVALEDRVEVVDVEKSDLAENLPSLVYLHRNEQWSAGREAIEQYLLTAMDRTACRHCGFVNWIGQEAVTDCDQFRQGGSCNDSRLLAGIKSSLADQRFTSTHSWGFDFEPADLTAVILRRLKRAADRRYNTNVKRVVLGHPVAFVGAEGAGGPAAQRLGLDRLVRAAGSAGFEEIEVFPEPSAALEEESFSEGTILAVDFGGGTFDAAVIRAPRLPGVVAGLAGTGVGGQDFDAALFDAKVAPELGLRSRYVDGQGKEHALPARFAAQLRRLSGLRQVLNDPVFGPVLREFQRYKGGERLKLLEEIIYGGFAYDLYAAIEQAKIDLSGVSEASIRLERGRMIDLDIRVTRPEFENLISDHLATIRLTIDQALDHAGIAADDVDVVVRTGGSSMIPAFGRLLEEDFGSKRIQERGPFTAIALGLARRAQEIWHA